MGMGDYTDIPLGHLGGSGTQDGVMGSDHHSGIRAHNGVLQAECAWFLLIVCS